MQKSRRDGYRSRAVYKLEECLTALNWHPKAGLIAVDLGAAPGGWSQYVARQAPGDARIIAIDVLPMEPLPGVQVIEGDFTEDSELAEIRQSLDGANVDLVLSDMAPNISGVKAVDQPRAMYLAELALDFAVQFLAPNGCFICKVFQGEGFDAYLATARAHFSRVKVRKPKASRGSSREVYLLARN